MTYSNPARWRRRPTNTTQLAQPKLNPHAQQRETGTTSASSTAADSVILWDLTTLNDLRDHAIEHACSITGGSLDRGEWGRYIPGLAYQNTCSPAG
jgi:hypothetical protein